MIAIDNHILMPKPVEPLPLTQMIPGVSSILVPIRNAKDKAAIRQRLTRFQVRHGAKFSMISEGQDHVRIFRMDNP